MHNSTTLSFVLLTTWLLANKCEIRIKNCFLRFSKSFAGSDVAVAAAAGKAGTTTDDIAAVAFAVGSGDLLRSTLRMSTSLYIGERLRERVLLEPLDFVRLIDLCEVLRFDLVGELAGELLLRLLWLDGELPLWEYSLPDECLSRELDERLTGELLLFLCLNSEPEDELDAVELFDSLRLRLLLEL